MKIHVHVILYWSHFQFILESMQVKGAMQRACEGHREQKDKDGKGVHGSLPDKIAT